MSSDNVYILLGSNLGDRRVLLKQAVAQIQLLDGVSATRMSSVYESEAIEMTGDNPPFLNQVLEMGYAHSPTQLLAELEKIEGRLGREEKGKYQSRLIDIDILLFGNDDLNSELLIIPHPRMLTRAFALVPLLEIAPDLVHPVTGKPIQTYLTTQMRQQVALLPDHVAQSV